MSAMRIIAATLALAVIVPAAQATPPGERGPIAFHRITDLEEEDRAQVFTIRPSGQELRQLTSLQGGSLAPEFSPDGSQIAFEHKPPGGQHSIFRMAADGSGPVPVTTGCVPPGCLGDDAASWMPSGEILFQRGLGPVVGDYAFGVDLMAVAADGTGQRVLHRFRRDRGGREPIHDAQPSPDGRLLAVTLRNTTAQPELGSAIHLLDADGRHLRRITPPRLNAGNPDWSPDGRRIVFNSSFEGQGRVEIYTVRPDGTRLRRVRREPRTAAAFEPVWSPDGARIAFVHATTKALPHIWTMRADGTGVRRITDGQLPDFRPDWGTPRG